MTSERIGDPDHDREAYLAGGLKGRFQIDRCPAFRNRDIMLDHRFLEQLTVVSDLNALDSGAENPHVVFRQNTAFCELHTTVEGSLSPKA